MDARGQLRRPSVAAAVILFLVAVLVFLHAAPAQAQDADEFVNGEIVVKLKAGVNINDFNALYGTATKETFLSSRNIHLLRVADGEDTETKADRMESDVQRVLYAEPNLTTDAPEGNPRMRARGDGIPVPSSDPGLYSGQYAVGALNLGCTRAVGGGSGAVVAVLDTGAQLNHPDLSGSLVPGYDFVADDADPADVSNGLDDDADGYVDETRGHGTHVAGIVHLVAPQAKIMPLRVLNSDGMGNAFVIAEAAQYAIENGADVINMSLSSSQESELLGDVIEDLETDDDGDADGPALEGAPPEGVVVTASAGNDNVDSPLQFPAAEDGVLGVTSVNWEEKKSEWANFGSWVQIAAPGEDIYSPFPTSRYASWEGTSMAAPFVAGQAALIRSLQGSIKSEEVGNVIRTTARSVNTANPAYSGKLGAGHADVGASIEKVRPGAGCSASANKKPTISSVSPAPGTITTDRTPAITAIVRDSQTELKKADITLYIDNRAIARTAFSYNVANDRLLYTSTRSLPYGEHLVTISARDAQGLVGSRTWSFKVVQP